MKKRVNKDIIILVLLFVIISSFITFKIYPHNIDMPDEYQMCFDQVRDGRLYDRAVHCHQGITGYVLLAYISDFNTKIISIFISTIILLLLFLIIKKRYILTTILVLFLIVSIVAADKDRGLFVLISIAFMLLSYYYILKGKPFLIGLFASLSVTSKLFAIYPLIILILYYVYKNYKDKRTYLIFLSVILVAIIYKLLFPLYIEYMFIANGTNPVGTYSTALSQTFNYLFNFSKVSIAIIGMFLVSLYISIKKKDVVSFALIASTILIILSLLKVTGDPYFMQYRYLLIPFSLFIISFNKVDKKYLYLFLIPILLLPINMLYLDYEYLKLDKMISEPLNFIPQQKFILSDENVFKNQKNVKVIKNVGAYDGWVGPRHELRNLINLSEYVRGEWNKTLYENSEDILINQKYSLIFLGPDQYLSSLNILGSYYRYLSENLTSGRLKPEEARKLILDVDELLKYKENITQENNMPFLGYEYCIVEILSIIHKSHHDQFKGHLLFKDFDECKTIKEEIRRYYQDNFDKICNKDEVTANKLFLIYGFDLNERCKNNKNLFYNLNNEYYNFFNINKYNSEKEDFYYTHKMFYDKECKGDINITNIHRVTFNKYCNKINDCIDFLKNREDKESPPIEIKCEPSDPECIKYLEKGFNIKITEISNIECS